MAQVAARALVEPHRFAVESDVVDRQVRMVHERVFPKGANSPHCLLMVGDVVERVRPGLLRAGGDPQQSP